MLHRCLVSCVLCLAVATSVFAQGNIDAEQREQIKALVEQLSAPSQRQRQAAQDALLEIGPNVEDYLKAERMNPDLGFEQKRRIDWLLERVGTPEFALIWRGQPRMKVPKGLEYGSLIIGVNDREFKNDSDMDSFWEVDGYVRLKLWEFGKDPKWISTQVSEKQLHGFNRYPDRLSEYDKHGHKGEWSFVVRRGLQIARDGGNPEAIKSFQKAWDMGCRDPMVLGHWAWILCQTNAKASLELLNEKMPDVLNTYPGGTWRYGQVPGYRAIALASLGRIDEAIAYFETAIEEAKTAKAHAAVPILVRDLAPLKRQVAPENFYDFLREHPEMNIADLPVEILLHYAEDIAGGLQAPKQAVTFLKNLQKDARPDIVEKIGPVERTFVRQAELAEAWTSERPHRVLVRLDAGIIDLREGENQNDTVLLPPMSKTGSFEAQVVFKPPRTWNDSTCFVAVGLREKCKPSCGGYHYWDSFVSDNRGNSIRFRPFERNLMRSVDHVGTNFYTARKPYTVRFDVEPGRRSIYMNGKPRRIWYGDFTPDVRFGPLRPALKVTNAYGEIKNMKWYVFSAVDVDNEAVEKTLRDIQTACHEGNLEKVRELYNQLFALWKDVPEAADAIKEHRQRLTFYEQIFTPEGLDLCDLDLLRHPQTLFVGTDRCIVNDDWLAIQKRGCKCAFSYPIALPQSVEISGLMQTTRPVNSGTDIIIMPNSMSSLPAWTVHFSPAFVYTPKGKKVKLTARVLENKEGETAVTEEVASPKPFAFCLRGSAKGSALFINNPDKPLLTLDQKWGKGNRLAINYDHAHSFALLLGHARVRAIDADTALDAPATLPKIVKPEVIHPVDLLEQALLKPKSRAAFTPILTLKEVRELIRKRKQGDGRED